MEHRRRLDSPPTPASASNSRPTTSSTATPASFANSTTTTTSRSLSTTSTSTSTSNQSNYFETGSAATEPPPPKSSNSATTSSRLQSLLSFNSENNLNHFNPNTNNEENMSNDSNFQHNPQRHPHSQQVHNDEDVYDQEQRRQDHHHQHHHQQQQQQQQQQQHQPHQQDFHYHRPPIQHFASSSSTTSSSSGSSTIMTMMHAATASDHTQQSASNVARPSQLSKRSSDTTANIYSNSTNHTTNDYDHNQRASGVQNQNYQQSQQRSGPGSSSNLTSGNNDYDHHSKSSPIDYHSNKTHTSFNNNSTTPHQPPPAKRQRNRQQLSCVSCHLRKQACDKVVPCSRCIKRGVADECRIEGRSHPPLRNQYDIDSAFQSADEGPSPGRSNPSSDLHDRVKTLETTLRRTSLPQAPAHLVSQPLRPTSSSAAYSDASPSAAYEAARALDRLGRVSTPVSDMNDGGSERIGGHQDFRSFYSPRSGVSILHQPDTRSNPVASLAPENPRLPALLTQQQPHQSRSRRSIADNQILDLTSALPQSRVLSDFLVDLFFSPKVLFLAGQFCVTRKDVFERNYRAILDWRDQEPPWSPASSQTPRGRDAPTSISFISLLNIVMATALQFLSDSDYSFVSRFTVDHRVVESSLRAHAKLASDLSEAEDPPDLFRVEALMLQAMYTYNCNQPSISRNLVAVGIRAAQLLGLHREARDETFSPYEVEIRRRLWWSVYTCERSLSLALGRPDSIRDHFCDSLAPANVDINLLDPFDPYPFSTNPLTEWTPTLMQICSIGLSRISGDVTELLLSPRSYTYAQILTIDEKLLDYENSLPPHFRTPSFDSNQSPTSQIPTDLAMLYIQLLLVRLQLHRIYLLRRITTSSSADPTAHSRMLTITLCQRLISVSNDAFARMTRAQKRFASLPLFYFEAATTLIIANFQDSSSTAFTESNDRSVLDARDGLISMGTDNIVASEALACIDALQQRFATYAASSVYPASSYQSDPSQSSSNHAPFMPIPNGGKTSAAHARPSLPTPSPSSGALTIASSASAYPQHRQGTPSHAHDRGQPGTQASSTTLYDSFYDDYWLRPINHVWPLGCGALEFNQPSYWMNVLQQLDLALPNLSRT